MITKEIRYLCITFLEIYMNLKYILAFFGTILLSSCHRSLNMTDAGDAGEAADSFAVYYFNWQYDKAARFVTEESLPWLSYAASQVQQEDIDILRQKEDATVEVEDVETDGEDKTVVLTVRDFLRMDTIGTAGHLVREARFRLPMKSQLENGKQVWKVRMEGLPRSERRSRD